MKKILNIISSPRGAASASIQLAQTLIDQLTDIHPGSIVKTSDLTKKNFPHLEESHLASFFTPPERHTDKDKLALRHSDEAIKEILDADIIIIGAPVYNFSIHSTLKAWLDHIVRSGITFRKTETGVEGLIHGKKKVYLIISSGGVYSEGPMKTHDYVEPYLRFILGFIGLTDVTVFRAEGLTIPGNKDVAMEKAIAGVRLSRSTSFR